MSTVIQFQSRKEKIYRNILPVLVQGRQRKLSKQDVLSLCELQQMAIADRIQSANSQLQCMCLAAQYLVLGNSLAAQIGHEESKRSSMKFPPDMPQD